MNRPRFEDTKRLLYREFFPRLQREFNGTMFDTALADEARNISKAHINILADFLSGHDMESGQITLGFWAYDFQTIPVETISAIYEEFLKDKDLNKKRNAGAYYTPRHLAETTLHVALDGRYMSAEHWRAFDPACGSGIFLVAMFNLCLPKSGGRLDPPGKSTFGRSNRTNASICFAVRHAYGPGRSISRRLRAGRCGV